MWAFLSPTAPFSRGFYSPLWRLSATWAPELALGGSEPENLGPQNLLVSLTCSANGAEVHSSVF